MLSISLKYIWFYKNTRENAPWQYKNPIATPLPAAKFENQKILSNTIKAQSISRQLS